MGHTEIIVSYSDSTFGYLQIEITDLYSNSTFGYIQIKNSDSTFGYIQIKNSDSTFGYIQFSPVSISVVFAGMNIKENKKYM